jgi:hypothetical protein
MQKVSIILPVYNVERYLALSLDTVLKQTHENWELLISDNCSQDKTGEIAMSYAVRDNRIIYWKNDANLGVVENYNRCIERATGDYIELFGGDDLFEPQCLEKLVQILDTNTNVVLVTCARNIIDETGECTKVEHPFPSSRLLPSEEAIRSNMGPLTNWIVSPVMYRARYKATGFDTSLRIWSDLDYWVRILEKGDLYYLDEILFSYRVHRGSETSRAFRDLEFAVDMLRLADKHARYIVDPGKPELSLKSILGAKLLALCHHATHHRGATFDSLLGPLDQHSAEALVAQIDTQSDLNLLKEVIYESHDHRRAACLAILCGADLQRLVGEHEMKLAEFKMQIDAVEENRDIIRGKRDTAVADIEQLNKRINELKKEIAAMKDEHANLSMQRDAALRERESISSRVEELKEEMFSLRNSLSWKITAPLRRAKQKAPSSHH